MVIRKKLYEIDCWFFCMYARHFIFLPIFSLSVSENVQRLGEDETLSRFDAMPCLSSFFLYIFPSFQLSAVTRPLHDFPTLVLSLNSSLSSRQVHKL